MFTPPTKYSGSTWANMRIGLLGGSFNPAHAGHRHISLLAMKHLNLDAVWWMVSPQNPLKSTDDMAPFEARLQSAEDISHHPHIIATNIEVQLGTQYTADTLTKLKTLYSQTCFIWLMGADNLYQIHKWERWKDIFHTFPLCVLARPPQNRLLKSAPAIACFRSRLTNTPLTCQKLPQWTILHTPLCDLSSTRIRHGKTKEK